MDKQTATEFVTRIEAHREQEQAIWQEMRDRPGYAMHEDNVIVEILDARKTARDQLADAEANLGSFDWVDDGAGNLVPREELAQA